MTGAAQREAEGALGKHRLMGSAMIDRAKKGCRHGVVGAATAAAAEGAGLRVANVGCGGVADVLAALPGSLRLLHLVGENRIEGGGPHHIDRRTVYRSKPIVDAILPPLEGMVAAVHSPRAGSRLAELVPARHDTAIAAISAAAAEACGAGWERIEVAQRPDDPSLLALAAMLCHTSTRR